MEGTQVSDSATPVSTRHNKKNDKFANDGSYESVKGLVMTAAIKCFRRVEAFGLGMTIDDVRQEMYISYMQALKKWDPSRGILFSTYLTTALYRNFNEVIRRAEVERRNLGLVNMTDMRRTNSGSDMSDDECDLMGVFGPDPEIEVNLEYGSNEISGKLLTPEAPMHSDPSVYMEVVQEAHILRQQTHDKLGSMTDNAKAVISRLLMADHARTCDDKEQPLPKLTAILREAGHSEKECRRIRKEIIAAFGVRV